MQNLLLNFWISWKKVLKKLENTSMNPGHHITHIIETSLRVKIQGQLNSGRTVISVIVQESDI